MGPPGAPGDDAHQQGLAEKTGLNLGTATIVTSLAVLATWFPLGEKPGLGTALNASSPARSSTSAARSCPRPTAWDCSSCSPSPRSSAPRSRPASSRRRLGPGPARRAHDRPAQARRAIAVARTGIEATVLVVGWLLGGTVGVATVLFALSIGD